MDAGAFSDIKLPDRVTLRFAALMAALTVYALAGSPTPDSFGIPEMLVGLLLIIAISLPRGFMALWPPADRALWRRAGWALLIYGLTVPVLTGIARGHDAGGLVLRDVVPFLFALLPLFIAPLVTARAEFKKPVTVMTGMCGVAFAGRVLFPVLAHPAAYYNAPPDPQYLANAPTVLFAAIAAVASAASAVMRAPWRVRSWMVAGLLGFGALICVGAMAEVMQRATLGLMAVILALLWAVAFVKRPLRALIPLGAVLLMAALCHGPVFELAQHLMEKTAQVGFNNRLQEAQVALHALGDNPYNILFGLGWGQTIVSPAVGDVPVNYTHTFVSALWLKGGLAAVGLAGAYLAGLFQLLWIVLWRHPVMAAAIAAPVMIDIMLYASYKSLDFGLVLMLIPLWAGHAAKVAPAAAVVYSDGSATV